MLRFSFGVRLDAQILNLVFLGFRPKIPVPTITSHVLMVNLQEKTWHKLKEMIRRLTQLSW